MRDILYLTLSARDAIKRRMEWQRRRALKRALMRPGYRPPTEDDWRLLQDHSPPRSGAGAQTVNDGPEAA